MAYADNSTVCLKIYTCQSRGQLTGGDNRGGKTTLRLAALAEGKRRSLRRAACAKLGDDLPLLPTTQGSACVSGSRSNHLQRVLRDEATRRDRLSGRLSPFVRGARTSSGAGKTSARA